MGPSLSTLVIHMPPLDSVTITGSGGASCANAVPAMISPMPVKIAFMLSPPRSACFGVCVEGAIDAHGNQLCHSSTTASSGSTRLINRRDVEAVAIIGAQNCARSTMFYGPPQAEKIVWLLPWSPAIVEAGFCSERQRLIWSKSSSKRNWFWHVFERPHKMIRSISSSVTASSVRS